ncbi:MAG TPA: hypothetical protein VM287_02655 [Egibacteraceae bacterium]|nr:hypothetical protein [Egibacteraceae bacterium]
MAEGREDAVAVEQRVAALTFFRPSRSIAARGKEDQALSDRPKALHFVKATAERDELKNGSDPSTCDLLDELDERFSSYVAVQGAPELVPP